MLGLEAVDGTGDQSCEHEWQAATERFAPVQIHRSPRVFTILKQPHVGRSEAQKTTIFLWSPATEFSILLTARRKSPTRVKYCEIIADRLSKSGWSWGCAAVINSEGRNIFAVGAHRNDGRRYLVRADDKLTAFLEIERICAVRMFIEKRC